MADIVHATLTGGDLHVPKAHAASHQNGGSDEISVAGLSGLLADNQNPTAHASEHTDGTDDIQDATAAQKGVATAAQITKLDGIEALADVTDATNVASAGASMTTHRHDTETLEHDGVNSDGGAFSFTTSGQVNFSQDLRLANTKDLLCETAGGSDLFSSGTPGGSSYVNQSYARNAVADSISVASYLFNTQPGGHGGAIRWYSRRSDGAQSQLEAARISAQAASAWDSDANSDSLLRFSIRENNVLTEYLRFHGAGRYISWYRDLNMIDTVNFLFSTVTGTKIGTATGQKLGFWNTTPVVQPAHIADADGTLADITTKFNTLLAQQAATGLQAAS